MKKIITLAMVLAMCMSLMACGISEKDLIGTWRNTTANSHSFTLFLEEGKEGTLKIGENEEAFTWEIEDETLILDQNDNKVNLSINESEDKIELNYSNGYYVLVPEDEYNTLFETVEITMDNWQDYFEIKHGIDVDENDFDEIEWIGFGEVFAVKEEYAEKMVGVNLAIEYEISGDMIVAVEYNTETQEIVVSEPYPEDVVEEKGYYLYTNEGTTGTTTFNEYNMEKGLTFYGYQGPCTEDVDLTGEVICFDAHSFVNYDVVRIQGSISVRK